MGSPSAETRPDATYLELMFAFEITTKVKTPFKTYHGTTLKDREQMLPHRPYTVAPAKRVKIFASMWKLLTAYGNWAPVATSRCRSAVTFGGKPGITSGVCYAPQYPAQIAKAVWHKLVRATFLRQSTTESLWNPQDSPACCTVTPADMARARTGGLVLPIWGQRA